jgi:hypothetical protein
MGDMGVLLAAKAMQGGAHARQAQAQQQQIDVDAARDD